MPESLHEQFNQLAKLLLEQGEDADEMLYWMDIFPDLPEDTQRQLFSIFQKEVEQLGSQG